ncbi:unnamed protein product, partial [Meganyctiphanes norvegica]
MHRHYIDVTPPTTTSDRCDAQFKMERLSCEKNRKFVTFISKKTMETSKSETVQNHGDTSTGKGNLSMSDLVADFESLCKASDDNISGQSENNNIEKKQKYISDRLPKVKNCELNNELEINKENKSASLEEYEVNSTQNALKKHNYKTESLENKSGNNEELKNLIDSERTSRYPKRKIQRKRFIRHLGPQDFQKAEGIYCIFCKRRYYTMCITHPLTLIKNVNVTRDGSVTDRIHKSAPFPLKVTKSLIPGAGEGVLTTHDLPPGLVFGPYEGVIVPHVTEENETGYGWEINE